MVGSNIFRWTYGSDGLDTGLIVLILIVLEIEMFKKYKFEVDLMDDENLLGIIIPCNSGIIYRNQVGGVRCIQAEAEGAFMPLYETKGPPHHDNCGTIDPDAFDDYFSSQISLRSWRVDRSVYSLEAWVHIISGEERGIFTYANCD